MRVGRCRLAGRRFGGSLATSGGFGDICLADGRVGIIDVWLLSNPNAGMDPIQIVCHLGTSAARKIVRCICDKWE